MKGSAFAALFGAVTIFGASTASAESDARVYDDAAFGERPNPTIRSEVDAVEKGCQFEIMSREGPRRDQVARCDAAVSRVSKRGPAAIGAILAALDRGEAGYHASSRLYDVLARTGDTRLIEPLIKGMARIATRKLKGRDHELAFQQEALAEITRASIGQDAPWVRRNAKSLGDRTVGLVVDWRLWADEHAGRSHAELAEERLADSRAHAEDADPARAYEAVSYLLKYEPTEGLPFARKLVDRDDLPKNGKSSLSYEIDDANARAKAPVKAKASPSKKKAAAVDSEKQERVPPPKQDVGGTDSRS